jgi:hypothetical protein
MQDIVDGILGVPIQPRRNTWNKIKNGQKVAGDHKKTDGTTKKPETIAEVGGKINMSIRNFHAKQSRYGVDGYKKELYRYLNELKEMGGQPTAEQHEKLRVLADSNEDLRNLMHIFAEGPQEEQPPIEVDDPMVRPQDTPRRPSPGDGEQPPSKRPNIAPRVLAPIPTEATTLQTAAATQPFIATAPPTAAPSAATPMAASGSLGGPSGGGSDSSGNNAIWSCQSFPPEYREGPDGLTITFGGSRLQYTWAMDMRTHNVADEGDFVPMGHSVPWHWIPFYCTPAEWESLPWKTHNMKIKRVGVAVTPLGKEVQFATASGNSTIASNEHLAIGYKNVGMNLRSDLPATGIRRVKNNETGTTLITNASSEVSYIDLRKRYWGPLSDFTLNTDQDSYTTSKQVSTAELSIRENEIVAGIYVDKFDKTTKANNKASFGSILKDRYIERFPLVPSMGVPIIKEVYEPKFGIINDQQHRILIQNKQSCQRGSVAETAQRVWTEDPQRKNNYIETLQINNYFSRNSNIGETALSQIGSYHANVEKFRVLGMGDDRHVPQSHNHAMPMITFGIAPIRLINLTSSTPEYVNARCVWKIDYFMEIQCSFQKPSHCYATNISADGTVYPPTMYTSPLPRTLLHPINYSTATGKTDQPNVEELAPAAFHHQKDGFVNQNYGVSETLAEVMGAGTSTACWSASTGGVIGV